MKLIEISVLILLLPLFALNFASGCGQFLKVQEKLRPMEKNFQRDLFISSSFQKICANSDEEKFLPSEKISEWKKICGNLFGDEGEIKVTREGFKDKSLLFKCEWKSGENLNQVFAVVSSD